MEEQKNPITFQCISCNTIITDSFFLMERVEDNLLFTAAPNTIIDNSIISTAETDSDETYCSYSIIRCICNKEIGRKYVTVNDSLTNCLNNYLIQIKNIRGYQLGMKAQTKEAVIMTNSEINTEIIKLQRFCTFLYNKIKEIK
ncbi:hypothetical protein NEPAR06_0045 [Nematocida parisii]|uniref:Protein yippee-like n=1 Tax=Nematocida parisii (strain ERTm3) TaxID=935791 RepID=I3EE11_NEMP3|nr:uncharacterized protein NEPG_00060 [Nematocida parisii ERTm1]EIJ87458.1 hypothetical protein NEQG_02339 [Nematocida parisii ERTm3]KAI5127089.1 hypothetical protein NEPAR08_0761 [Nematocida parisii]EIJ94538.1 hypothetical protein NEPG_00060 [Nematocida parisii ERTm1]KAI5127636.1 hypothetical protein NEPAR03_1026 [Nematocida parisii]KAI5141189.1 hypothetical protein NEPAR04_0760 [Nematocida parisii]|eukprot:XP_013057894.1 hypothetical protein NEPG_00060 [Nematocida parisii ERTm1]